jgi:hypothetical protein
MDDMRTLQILEVAYRATLEEQDDPVLWLAGALQAQGAAQDVLLAGSSVAYAVRGQNASGLVFGARPQSQPPRLEEDLARLADRGAALYVVEEDLVARGIGREELVRQVVVVRRAALPGLLRGYARVWSW